MCPPHFLLFFVLVKERCFCRMSFRLFLFFRRVPVLFVVVFLGEQL